MSTKESRDTMAEAMRNIASGADTACGGTGAIEFVAEVAIATGTVEAETYVNNRNEAMEQGKSEEQFQKEQTAIDNQAAR